MDAFMNLSSLGIGIGCICLSLLISWILYSRSSLASKRLKGYLFFIRAAAISTILFLLTAPLLRLLSYEVEKPILVIGLDNSASVQHFSAPGFSTQKFEQDLNKMIETLLPVYDVKTFHFATEVKAGLKFEKYESKTNIGKFINHVKTQYGQGNVAAVVLATDGNYNQGLNPLNYVNGLNAKIYPIPLGDTILRRDLKIVNVEFPKKVLVNQQTSIKVFLEANEASGKESELEIRLGNQVLKKQKIRIQGSSFKIEVPFSLSLNTLGWQELSLVWNEIEGEISKKNNYFKLSTEVVNSAHNVLILSANPHPDITTIKASLESQAGIKVEAFDIQSFDLQQLGNFDFVILHQLPDPQAKSKNVIRSLNELGVPVWYIVGVQTSIKDFNEAQSNVQINKITGTTTEVFANKNADFSGFKLRMQEFDLKLPPLVQITGEYKTAGINEVYFNYKRGSTASNFPLWFQITQGNQLNTYLLAEGLWKWKLALAQQDQAEVLDEMINHSILAALNEDRNDRLKVYLSQLEFDESEAILFDAEFYDNLKRLDNSSTLKLEIKNQAGKKYNYIFNKERDSYHIEVAPLPVDKYSYKAFLDKSGNTYDKSGQFIVKTSDLEWMHGQANLELLREVATKSNGKVYAVKDLQELAQELNKPENKQTISYEKLNYKELIHFKWLFFLILSLLSMEWFFRKRNGEI